MAGAKNPIIGGLISGLVGGIPDLVAGIRENRAAKKAEKFKAAGTQQIAAGALLGGVVENPEAIINMVSGLAGNGQSLNIPDALLDLPIGFQITYIVFIVGGIVVRMVGSAYQAKADKQQQS
ncbi:MAG: hypothetical protein K9G46_07125 [Flavobacteriales bacterium]|nr:hypothetical protein [Flavobacteriales bacterium]